MSSLSLEMSHSFRFITEMIVTTTRLLTRYTSTLNMVSYEMDQFYFGISAMLQGSITPSLIDPDTLFHCIHNIKKHLQKSHPLFHLTHTHIKYYYTTHDFYYTRHGRSIFVTVKFPILSQREVFTVYQVSSFPVPLNHSSNHTTQLLSFNPYIVISPNSNYFAELDSSSYQRCSGKTIKHCRTLLTQRSIEQPTCLSALFFEQTQLVHSLCDFRYLHNSVSPFITQLDPHSILISRIHKLSLTCQSSTHIIEKDACDFCIINIPCNCAVSAGKFWLPPRITGCVHHMNITKSYPVNLAVLVHFFDHNKLTDIKGSTTFPELLNISLPLFNLYQHNFTQLIAADEKVHLSLERIAKRAKTNQVIYKSISDSILSGQVQPESQIDQNTTWWSLLLNGIPLIVSVASLSISVFLWCKSKSIAAIVQQ